MATVGSDTFTESSAVSLDAHTPDVGSGWTEETNNWSIDPTLDVAHGVTNGNELARKGDDIGDDDMDITGVGLVSPTGSAVRRIGIAGRMSTDGFSNQYTAELSRGDVFLFKEVAGARTELGSYTAEILASATLKLVLRTNSQEVFVDGISRITASDTSITGRNFAGMIVNGSTTASSISSFLSESVAAVATPSFLVRRDPMQGLIVR